MGNRRIVLKQTTEKIIDQEGGFLNFLGPIIKHVLTPISGNVLLLLGVTAVVSASDAAIQNKIYESGMTAMIIWNKEMKNIMKMVTSLEETGLLIKSVSNKIENEANKQKVDFLAC